tara:strand:+ start:11877 stop:12278 length:402 start_codon:yes stop_codon:yes gene_type:complete
MESETPAQIFTFDELNILGNIINHTFGKSSIRDKGIHITTSLQGNLLTLTYNTIVHFNSTDGLATQKKEQVRLSNKGIESLKKEMVADFRDQASRSLKIKEISNEDDVELVSATANSSRKIAYYRRKVTFEIS